MGAEAIIDILEYANAQLVEFRTYDARLDEEHSRPFRNHCVTALPRLGRCCDCVQFFDHFAD